MCKTSKFIIIFVVTCLGSVFFVLGSSMGICMILVGFILGDSGFYFGENSGFPLIKRNDFIEFVTFFRKEGQVLLINGLDEANTEFVLSGVFKGGIVVHVLFEGLAGANNIVIGKVQKDAFKLKFLGTWSGQLISKVLFSNIFKDLDKMNGTLMSSA